MIQDQTVAPNPKHEKIERLQEFKALLKEYSRREHEKLRSEINQKKTAVRNLVIEAGAFKTYTIGPPPAIGGLVMQNVDLFGYIFDPPYLMNVSGTIIDMIDEAIGNIDGGVLDQVITNTEVPKSNIRSGYAFIAMSINPSNKELEDVLDAIKAAAHDMGIEAERIDEQESNNRITDRIFEAIRVAQFVIVDVTGARPNVFYEAGYAQGIGKIPIFLAKEGTKPEFDISDYPIIFYDNMRTLRERLKNRLQTIAEGKSS